MLLLLKRFILFFGAWLALTASDPSAWIAGAAAAAASAFVSLRLLPPGERRVRLDVLLRLAPGFAWRSLLGGVDVAWRAFHPRLPVRPAWIAYPMRLPPGAPRVTLGSEISLMPGTLAAGVHGDALCVHSLDGERPVEAEVAAEEDRIAESLGLRLEASNG